MLVQSTQGRLFVNLESNGKPKFHPCRVQEILLASDHERPCAKIFSALRSLAHLGGEDPPCTDRTIGFPCRAPTDTELASLLQGGRRDARTWFRLK